MVEDDEADKEKLAPATGTKREGSLIKRGSVQAREEEEQKRKEGQ